MDKKENKFTVAILGIGGVGGFLGGKLAQEYLNSQEVEIIFIARGENAKAIRSDGLTVITEEGAKTGRPFAVTDGSETPGILDFVICCVKSYDLETSLGSLKNSITSETVILPFLNGLDASERVRRLYPESTIWDGCAYIVSKLVAPGTVKVTGNTAEFYFGAGSEMTESLDKVYNLFIKAGIGARVSRNMRQVLWEKFLFISPFATITSAYDLCLGDILKNDQYKKELASLMREVKSVGSASGIIFHENIIQTHLERMRLLPPEATSSMHNDFRTGRDVELGALTTHVIDLGKQHNVMTEMYLEMLGKIERKWLPKMNGK